MKPLLTRGNSITEGVEEYIEQIEVELEKCNSPDYFYKNYWYAAEVTTKPTLFEVNITMKPFFNYVQLRREDTDNKRFNLK